MMMSRQEAAEQYPFMWRWPNQNDEEYGWQPAGDEDGSPVQSLELIPLAEQVSRTLWAGDFGDSFPVCKSDNGILGTVLEAEASEALGVGGAVGEQRLCAECPAASRKGATACKAQHIIWALTRKHHSRPIRVRIPHYAAKGLRDYLRKNGRGFFGTRVVALTSKDWTDRFPKLAVETVRDLDEAGLQITAEVRDNHIWGMLAMGVNFDAEPEAADTAAEADLLFGPVSTPAKPTPAEVLAEAATETTTEEAADGDLPHVE